MSSKFFVFELTFVNCHP